MRVTKDEVVFSSLGRFCPSSLLSYQAEAPLAIASAFNHITFGLYLHIMHAFNRGENLHPKFEASCNSLYYTKHMITHVFEDLRKRKAPNRCRWAHAATAGTCSSGAPVRPVPPSSFCAR
jgi:hypothetical protein